MAKNYDNNQIALKNAREIVGKLIEARFLGPSGLPEAISILAGVGRVVLGYEAPAKALVLKTAKELCLKLIERSRIINAQAAAQFLLSQGLLIAKVANENLSDFPWLLTEAKELTIKMIETDRLSPDKIDEFFQETACALAKEL